MGPLICHIESGIHHHQKFKKQIDHGFDPDQKTDNRKNAAQASGKILFSIGLSIYLILTGTALLPLHSKNLLSPGEWKEDLKYLSRTLFEKHPSPFRKTGRREFNTMIRQLEEKIPQLKDHEIITGLVRILAAVGDGHTRLTLPTGNGSFGQAHTKTQKTDSVSVFHRYPVQFSILREGLFITKIASGFEYLSGREVLRIGNYPAAEAIRHIRQVCHFDNEPGLKKIAQYMLTIPEILHALKISDNMKSLPIITISKEGVERSDILKPLEPERNIDWISPFDIKKTSPPLFLRHPEKSRWFTYLEKEKVAYLQLNSIQNGPDESLAAFMARIIPEAEKKPFKKFVLDIRLNGGGNNYLNRSVILSLVRSQKINRYGILFTIIGRDTFSAAMNLTSSLEQWTNTIFVGEPTGATPSHYGDAKKYTLPHSGLTARISSVYWRDWSVNEKRKWIQPGIPALPTIQTYKEGVDPAMKAVEEYAAPQTLGDQLISMVEKGDIDDAYRRYTQFKTDPDTAGISTKDHLIRVGEYLLDRGKNREAAAVFAVNLQDYPGSAESLKGLGRAHLGLGEKMKAMKCFKSALKMNPDDEDLPGLLSQTEDL